MKCNKCGKEFDESVSGGICPHCGNDNTVIKVKKVRSINPKWLQVGVKLQNRYEITEVIGDGGFGITYIAWDHQNRINVCIKEYFQSNVCNRIPGTTEVLIAAPNYKEEFEFGVERLLQEAKVVAKFSSPSIVRINDFFRENNTSYMVMEYLPYDDLRHMIDNRIVLNVKSITNIGIKVCEALEEIHASGVIHRDIAPDNILLTKNNEIKIIDFGSARLSPDDFDNSLITFKPGYTPWEQYNPLDPKNDLQKGWTDVYALGATLYVLLTGTMLPDCQERKQLVDEKNGVDPVAYPNTINKNIPENLSNTIMKAIAINIHERFQTATEFKQALMGERHVEKIESVREKKKKRRLISIAGGFLLGAVLAGSGFMIYRNKQSKFDFLPKATVNIWYSYDETDSDDSAKENMLNDIKSELKDSDQYRDVTINLKAIPSDEYEQQLEEAYQNGNMPTIYEVVGDGDYLNDAEDISDVVDAISDSCYMTSQFKTNTISTGINIPVAYINYLIVDDPDADIQFNFNTITDMEAYCEVGSMAYNLDDEVILTETISDFSKNQSGMLTGLEQFTDDTAMIYLSDTSECNEILSLNAAQYAMISLADEEQYVSFTDTWAMSNVDGNTEKDGKAILKYFMTSKAQTMGYIEDGRTGIPLEKNTLDSFKEDRSTYSNFTFDFDKYKAK